VFFAPWTIFQWRTTTREKEIDWPIEPLAAALVGPGGYRPGSAPVSNSKIFRGDCRDLMDRFAGKRDFNQQLLHDFSGYFLFAEPRRSVTPASAANWSISGLRPIGG